MKIDCRTRETGVIIREDGHAELFIHAPNAGVAVCITIPPRTAWALAARYGLLVVAEDIPEEYPE